MSNYSPEALLQADQRKLINFHRTFSTLNDMAKSMLRHFGQQVARPSPDYAFLSQVVHELQHAFKLMEKEVRTTCPVLSNLQARIEAAACLEYFQWQQDLRHYAVASAGEAIEEAKALSAAFVFRYQETLEEAENATPKVAAAFARAYDVLGIDETQIDFEKG